MRRAGWYLLLLACCAGTVLAQVAPPAFVNYQGVLRNATDDPQTGSFDMEFAFYDDADPDCGDGTLLLTDSHLAAGTGDVTVTGGLFNAQLGGGALTAGTEGSLPEVFRDHASVFLEVRVEAGGGGLETLCPRIRIVSAGFSLNADNLDGIDGAQFLRNDIAATFAGTSLTLNTGAGTNAILGEVGIDRPSAIGETFNITNSGAGLMNLQVDGFAAWHAGNDGAASTLDADLLDGNDSTTFINTGVLGQTKTGILTLGAGAGGGLTLNTAGGTNAVLGEVGLDRLSAVAETFNIQNSGAGTMALQVDGNTVWHGGNDGSLSTLDASLLDALDSTQFLRSDVATTFSGGTMSFNDATLINVLGSPGSLTVAGINLELTLGDSSFDNVILPGHILVNELTPTALQVFSSFGEADNKDETSVASGNDVYVEGDLEVDGVVFVNTTIQAPVNLLIVPGSSGDVDIGDGVTDLGQDLEVGGGGLCVDDDGSCVAPLDGHIKAFVFDAAGHSDVAEVYPSAEPLEPGDVVVLDRGADGRVRKSVSPYEDGIVSVISTAPGVLLGSPRDEDLAAHALDADRGPNYGQLLLVPGTYPVALIGRVPVKVSTENGPIDRGDMLTSSSTPGVAMKATQPSSVIGRALEPWNGTDVGKITVWVMPGWGASSSSSNGVEGSSPAQGAGASPSQSGLQGTAASAVPILGSGISSDSSGNVYARSFRPEQTDLASYQPISEAVEPGDVLVMDPEKPGKMRRADRAADTTVVGIAAGDAGFLVGSGLEALTSAEPDLTGQLEAARTAGDRESEQRIWAELEKKHRELQAPLALSGIVSCKVDAGYGPIRTGDLLTTSATPGHAMRATEPAPGTVLGKALEPLESGTGEIKVLVMLR